MTRKNLLVAITAHETTRSHHEARSEYAARGASRSMILSIEEMAENAKKMIAGEAIVSLDPNLLDGWFVSDRIENDARRISDCSAKALRGKGSCSPSSCDRIRRSKGVT